MNTYIKNISGINFEGCHIENVIFHTACSAQEVCSEPKQEEEAAPAETLETETVEEGGAQERDFKGLPIEERIRFAIERMREEGVFKYQYDYAWVMVAMQRLEELPGELRFTAPGEFYAYMKEKIGIEGLPSLSSIQRAYTKGIDARGLKYTETQRREGVKNRFISALRKGC